MNLKKFKDELSKNVTELTREEGLAQGICIICKNPPTWYSEAGRKEYRISATCEPCFDKLFEETE